MKKRKRKYTDEELIASLQELGQILGHAPTQREYKKYPNRIAGVSTICKHFKSWANACKKTGLSCSFYAATHARGKNKISEDEIRDILLDELYKTIMLFPEESIYAIIQKTSYSEQPYQKYFKSVENINKLLEIKYGIKKETNPKHKIKWTKEIIAAEFRRIEALLGYPPKYKDMAKYSNYCNINGGICKTYGSIPALQEAMGYKPHLDKTTEDGIQIMKRYYIRTLQTAYKNAPADRDKYSGATWMKLCKANLTSIRKYFKTTANWFKEAKLPIPKLAKHNTKNVPLEEAFKILRSMARKLKRAPYMAEYNKNPARPYNSHFLRRYFGRWKNVLQAAGIKNGRTYSYSREEVIWFIQDAAKKLKKTSFLYKEYHAITNGPKLMSIRRNFGTWKNALRAAGLLKEKSAV